MAESNPTQPRDRIKPLEARERMRDHEALLVCAYQSDALFRQNELEGAISFDEFNTHRAELPPAQEVIFYCACPKPGTADELAEQFAQQGLDTKVLDGGVEAWRDAGLPIVGISTQ